jgi:hypothetical protein
MGEVDAVLAEWAQDARERISTHLRVALEGLEIGSETKLASPARGSCCSIP